MLSQGEMKQLARIKEKFLHEIDVKFRKGAEEHNHDLDDLPVARLCEEIKEEALDTYV